MLLAISHRTGVRLAEVAFLLFVIAGIWIATASLSYSAKTHTRVGFVVVTSSRFRMVVGGLLLACGGVLLIVAAHWGRLFG